MPALPRRGGARPGRRPVQLALDGHPRGLPGVPRGGRDHRGRHPPPDPAPARPRFGRPAPSGRPPRPSCWPPPGRRRPPTAATWCRRSPGPTALDPGRRPLPGRGLRLRHQGGHAPPAGRPRHRDRGAGRHAGRRRPGPRTRRHLPLQRPGRPGGPAGRHRRDPPPGRPRHGPRLRHLPRPPAAGHRPGRHHLQAALRPPRRQPPGPPHVDRPGRDHLAEPQLRGGRRLAGGDRGDPRQPQRRGHRGPGQHRGPGLQRAVPPRGRSRPPRRPLPVRGVPDADGRPRRARAVETAGSPDAPPRRPRVDPGHRVRPDRDRPGLRVRLLGHPGLPGAGRGGLPGGAGQLQPGHDHDRPRAWPTAPTSSRSTPTC